MAAPTQIHLGVKNILGNASGIVAGATVMNSRQGDQAIRFDTTYTGTVLPAVVTVSAANGNIVFPAGTWMLCASLRCSQSGTSRWAK